MIFRALDESGDWVFGKGRGSYATGDTAIGLNIATRIKSWFGDCFFAQTEGIDWLNRLGSKNQRLLLETDLRRTILQSFGVAGIIAVDTILLNRNFTAKYDITTINSQSYKDSVEVGI